MRQRHAGAQVIPYPKYWRFAAAANRTVRHRQMIHGLFEADVTKARAILSAHKERTGETLSFTGFIAACLAKAVDEHKAVQAFHLGARRLVLFDDVDVNTRIERDFAGQKVVVPYIIRAANHKTFRQLHDEIRTVQGADANDFLTRFRMLSLMPAIFYKAFALAFAVIGRRRPELWKRTMGTVGLTAVGMFGNGAGWGVPASAPTALMVTVGGIGQKEETPDGRSATREYLSLTVSLDHDLVDGAPAARFSRRLKDLIERGYGLDEFAVEAEQGAAGGVAAQPALAHSARDALA